MTVLKVIRTRASCSLNSRYAFQWLNNRTLTAATNTVCFLTGVVLDDGSEIRSHIVIDTTGRGSKTPEWLQRRGLQAPDMISVDPKVASSSRMVKMPRNWDQVRPQNLYYALPMSAHA